MSARDQGVRDHARIARNIQHEVLERLETLLRWMDAIDLNLEMRALLEYALEALRDQCLWLHACDGDPERLMSPLEGRMVAVTDESEGDDLSLTLWDEGVTESHARGLEDWGQEDELEESLDFRVRLEAGAVQVARTATPAAGRGGSEQCGVLLPQLVNEAPTSRERAAEAGAALVAGIDRRLHPSSPAGHILGPDRRESDSTWSCPSTPLIIACLEGEQFSSEDVQCAWDHDSDDDEDPALMATIILSKPAPRLPSGPSLRPFCSAQGLEAACGMSLSWAVHDTTCSCAAALVGDIEAALFEEP